MSKSREVEAGWEGGMNDTPRKVSLASIKFSEKDSRSALVV